MHAKRHGTVLLDSLRKIWRDSDVRKQTREGCGLDDARIEAALALEKTRKELTQYAELMVREALIPVVQSQIARALKDTQGAKQFFELAQMAKLLEPVPQETDPLEEMADFERSIVEGLRSALQAEVRS